MKHELYKNKKDIENWLNQYGVRNYEIIEDKEYGYIVDVHEHVIIINKRINTIPIKFNIVYGDFDCSYNELITLKGSPEIVHGDFCCNKNMLKSLEYCPKNINGFMNAKNNKLKKLDFLPDKVNGICILSNNSELKEFQYIESFEELKKNHEAMVLNKKLEKEISIENKKNLNKIKL